MAYYTDTITLSCDGKLKIDAIWQKSRHSDEISRDIKYISDKQKSQTCVMAVKISPTLKRTKYVVSSRVPFLDLAHSSTKIKVEVQGAPNHYLSDLRPFVSLQDRDVARK